MLYYAKWLAFVFKQLVLFNVQNFKKLALKNIGLNPHDGLPKISVLDNVINCADICDKRKSALQNGKRTSERITDSYYSVTYLSIIQSLKALLYKVDKKIPFFEEFLNFITDKATE